MKRTIEIPNSKVVSRQVKLYVRYGSTQHYKATFNNVADAMAAVTADRYKIGCAGSYVVEEK